MTTIEYRCADGTPFPVTFDSEQDARRLWVREREHSVEPLTPLGIDTATLGYPGMARGFHDNGVPMPAAFGPGPTPFGFAYVTADPVDPSDMEAFVTGCQKLLEQWGSAEGIWRDANLPTVKASCAWLESAGDDVPVARLAEEQSFALATTMIPVLVSGNDIDLLTKVCTDVHGERAHLVALELTQGYPNETMRANEALWQLGRMVAASGRLREALDSADPAVSMAAIRSGGKERSFIAALDVFLSEFGGRAESWDIACPTWREQGPGLWGQLAQMARPEAVSPTESITRGAARRQELAAEIRERAAGDPAAVARFDRRLARVASYVAVREERALWQLIAVGALRHALLRRGRALAARGVIADPHDVLYLRAAEVDDPPGEMHATVDQRRAEHQAWRTRVPPDRIGGDQAPAPAMTDQADIRGIGASRGSVTARARVVTTLADASRLEPGEVLVCISTAPPWTPLFAVASAVVVDTGDLASHASITAREYGIPCVVGSGRGTSDIPDGATVTVDGASGLVTIKGPT